MQPDAAGGGGSSGSGGGKRNPHEDEERRLAYVAMSRAESLLFLTFPVKVQSSFNAYSSEYPRLIQLTSDFTFASGTTAIRQSFARVKVLEGHSSRAF